MIWRSATALFGETVIRLCRQVKRDTVTDPLVRQLVRAATSVGANYCEANDAISRKDFRHRIAICRKEAKELNLIFSSVLRRSEEPSP
jgi:four helix bundle protein